MTSRHSKVPELRHIARGTSFNFLGAISRNLLGFAFVFILARIMNSGEVGLFFLGVNVITLASIMAIGGMDVGLRRFVSIAHAIDDPRSAWDYFITAASIALVLCVVLGSSLYASSGWMAESLFSKPDLLFVLRSLIPYLLLYTFAELLLSVTQGYKHMQYWVLCLDIINGVLRIVFALVLSMIGLSLYGVIFGYLLAIFFSVVLAYYYFRKVMPPFGAGSIHFRFSSLMTFSFPVALARLVNSGNGMLETLLLGYFVAESDIGIYTVALKISVIGAIILASFNTMFAPIISSMHEKEQLQELSTLYSCVTRWAFSISLPIFLLVAWYASSIAMLFGSEYVSGADTVVVLCLGQIVNALTGPSGNLLLMSGFRLINLWTNMAGLALSVALNIILIPEYGVLGCAWAVAITVSVINITRVYLSWRVLHMHPYDSNYWKPVVAAVVTVILLHFLGPAREAIIGIFGLVSTGVLAILAYSAMLAAFGLNEEDRYVFMRVRSKFGGNKA